MKLHLKPVTTTNRKEIETLSLYPYQIGYIESVKDCLLEASYSKEWRTAGIYDNDTLVGFVMYGYFKKEGQVWLDRILIDKQYQGQGYGKHAIGLLLDLLYQEYHQDKIYLSVYEANKAAIQLYQNMGFHFNGLEDTKGEKIMVYDFSL